MKKKLTLITFVILMGLQVFAQNSYLQVVGRGIPTLANPIANISARDTASNKIIDLNNVFSAGSLTFNYAIVVNSDSSVAIASINGNNLDVNFIAEGQSNLIISAEYNGTTVYDTLVIGVLPVIEGDFEIVHFNDLTLDDNSFWNGSNGAGSFTSNLAKFHNDYNTSYMSWSGWAYSNMNDVTTAGYGNQFSAYTGAGLEPNIHGNNYAISDPYGASSLSFANNGYHQVEGIYVTNATYPALSMKRGDDYAKKFGGVSGNDEDWFKVSIWGKNNGLNTDTVDFYLADFRFADNSKDYILETWQWIDLSSLGQVDSLLFSLSSSDEGMFGMNTPAYFAMDNMTVIDIAPMVENQIADINALAGDANVEIDLSQVFSDADDVNSLMTFSVVSNSQNLIANAIISGHTLTIDFLSMGATDVVVQAKSNNKVVTDSFTINVGDDTSIEKLAETSVSIFPNPATDYFQISGANNSFVYISDVNGKLLYSQNVSTENESIDIAELPSAVYFVRIVNADKSIMHKIIKK